MRKILIVGGVAGGASTATRLRRLNENLEIIMFEKSEYISFANCGLPYHIGDVIKNRESLIIQTPEKIKAQFNIDARVSSEVIEINSEEKYVVVRKSSGEEYRENYDVLVLAPGAKPIVPPIEGIDDKNISTLRNIKDMDRIKNTIKEKNIKEAVVIGGGYVGVETAENLLELGLKTSLVEAGPAILAPFDDEISNVLENELQSKGLNLYISKKVNKFERVGEKTKVYFESGEVIETEMVVLSIGVTPDTNFLKTSGIKLGERGHILVDEFMETSVKDIYALGDSILVKNYITNVDSFIPLAGPANRQGRIVANNIEGRKEKYKGTLGTAILKVFELTAASTGLNEKTLKMLGTYDYEKIYLHPNDHASYYPGATKITTKLIYDKNSKKVLGAQAVGEKGVDKFIDVIATTIKFGGTMDDLAELDLAYAPPYSSAKSPANMAGFIGRNLTDNLIENIYVEDLKNYDKSKNIILDIREELELITGEFENSINIPFSEIRKRYTELSKEKEIWVYCSVGLRGYNVGRFLIQKGFKVKNISGGLQIRKKTIEKNNNATNNLASESKKTFEKIENLDDKDYLDLSGLSCPGPLVKIKENIDKLNENEILKVKVSDPGFYNDIQAWSKITKNTILSLEKKDGNIYTVISKGLKGNVQNKSNGLENKIEETNDALTIVVFSGDLDKAIAAFIIANGALAMGKKVTLFFTFWGLSALKKKNINKDKTLIEKMFAMMLPKSSLSLPISKMNMGGIGAKMIRWIMKSKEIMSLEELMAQSLKDGADIVACTMSMDVMGVKEEELIDGVKFGGVGQYLGEAEKANKNLFI